MERSQERTPQKVVVAARLPLALRQALEKQAGITGKNLSSHIEQILQNANQFYQENSFLKKKIAEQTQEAEVVNAYIDEADKKKLEALIEENTNLRKQIERQVRESSILNDSRLLFLLEKLRGKTDVVENAYGDNFPITYSTPQEVLVALIYSAKTK